MFKSLYLLFVYLCFFSGSLYIPSVSLTKLKNLRSLDISNTGFDTNNLIAIVEGLPHLESLNISNTIVDDISPLEKKKNKLRILKMYNLKVF